MPIPAVPPTPVLDGSRRGRMRFIFFSAILFLVSHTSWAELQDENILQNLPADYKIDFQAKQGNIVITEMVPQDESVRNWVDMLTTQIFLGLKTATPQQFRDRMQKLWATSCKGSESASVAEGTENGYPFAMWIQFCPQNRTTGRPENTWFKAIKGNDSFYVVQKAFKYEPSKEQVVKWTQYLRSVQVCDTRLADRPCPKLEKVNQ